MEFELKTPPIKSSLSIQSDDLNTLFDAYLLEEPEQSSFEEQEQQLATYVSSNLYSHKSKPKFMTPFNKFVDRESLKKECHSKRQQLKLLKASNQELRQKYSCTVLSRREVEEALYKLSEALPNGQQKERYFLKREKAMMEHKCSNTKEALEKLKKTPNITCHLEHNILRERLQSHTQDIRKELEFLKVQVQLEAEDLDLRPTEEEDYLALLDQIENYKGSWSMGAKCTLLNQKVEEDNTIIKLNDARTKNYAGEIKKKKDQLQNIQLINQGLMYEEEVFNSNRQQIKGIQEDILRLKEIIHKKKKGIEELKMCLDDKTNVLEYVKEWTEELREKLEERKRNEHLTKAKLEARINALSKEFEEWNSKYKMLVMQDQTTKLNKRDKEFKISDKNRYNPKLRPTKEYEVEGIFKRLNYQMCLRGISKEKFIEGVIGKEPTTTLKNVFERLKSSEIVTEDYHLQLLKMARYVVEDNQKEVAANNSAVEAKTGCLILGNMLGKVFSAEELSVAKEKAKEVMKKYYWMIIQKMPFLSKTDTIPEDRLREALVLCRISIPNEVFKAICLTLYEQDDSEVDKYSLSSFKSIYEKYAAKKSQLYPYSQSSPLQSLPLESIVL